MISTRGESVSADPTKSTEATLISRNKLSENADKSVPSGICTEKNPFVTVIADVGVERKLVAWMFVAAVVPAVNADSRSNQK